MGELIVTVDLMRRGYEVFRAISPGSSCDLLVFGGDGFKRVEVTKGVRSKIHNQDKLRWPSHDPKLYDILAVWEDNGTITYDPPL